MTDKEAPKTIWLNLTFMTWNTKNYYDDDIKYIRHDHFHACMEAAITLADALFDLRANNIDDVDVQMALDKWNRFLDGNNESPQG